MKIPTTTPQGNSPSLSISPGAEFHLSRIAQLGERQTEDLKVTCSIHVSGISFLDFVFVFVYVFVYVYVYVFVFVFVYVPV